MMSTELSLQERFRNNCVYHAPQDLIRATIDHRFSFPLEEFDRFQTKKVPGRGISSLNILEIVDDLLEGTEYRTEEVIMDAPLARALQENKKLQVEGIAADPRIRVVQEKTDPSGFLPCLMHFCGARDGGNDSHLACVTREETVGRLARYYDCVDMIIKIGKL